MNSNFFEIIRKYCIIEDIDFAFKNKSKDMHDILQNFNDYVNNHFFDCKITTDDACDYAHLPKTFVVEWTESYFLILQKEKNTLINLTSTDLVTPDKLLSKRVFYLSKELKNINDVDVFDAIKKMTPGASYFSLGLIFFALMTPLYSNLFNTRLIYSDSYHSVFFVTGVFIIFVIFELILKSMIYDKTSSQIRSNNIKCNAFFLYALKISNCRNAAVKIRTIESSVASFWESYPLISVDFSLTFLFIVCLFVMMGVYAFPLFIYYIALTILCVYIRFSAYKKTLQTNTVSYEKMSTLISLEEKRKELKFLRSTFFEKLLMDKTNRDEYTKMEMNIENHHWAEMIKANSFVSMIVMFISSYFAVVSGTLTTASIIAIMIINSRLSGALVGGINKLYLSRLHSFHIMNSLSELLKDKDTFVSHSGIYISRIQQLSVEKLSISLAERKLIEALSFTAAPGDFIGIVGASGAGKSSLIKALSNSGHCYTGSVKLNNVDITHISEEYIQSSIAYHSTNSSFIKGTLRENFMIYGVVDDSDIIEILTLCCRNLILSKENVDEKFIDELNLSNGEKQKILLYLALFKKPEMVFLDESTSYLSTIDALDFLERIKHLYADSIVIFATHDISLQRLFTRKIELSHEKLRTVSCSTTISIPKMKLNG
ncbi:TPA: ATP-binding cassette domain-containing protein [Salmonella enterica]|uniref:ATP-binding cassette domain-containing protein n=1 Tax=Salmonella enterica TaxID=28901 RepID=A0A701YZQ5_SALER|nr:ATP-binding cassette domain-containing protein [Salmonella enterica]EBH9038141.1 ATP-binding cassette domain-containing protein [Salmonella enterica subsp. indica serovar 11:b:e,n,x]HAC6566842.1 ATP-binding cassette domain-containing protein [Salmonella enterica subsp. indica]HCM1934626.1 ATP-binding cassette domain-containing protein [Salmonella enterica subsp. indica serovar 6,7:z41:1,7]HBC0142904.1 ATP-binding cassette domain-containing protein [Salmonella enterica subsp. indica serovar 1